MNIEWTRMEILTDWYWSHWKWCYDNTVYWSRTLMAPMSNSMVPLSKTMAYHSSSCYCVSIWHCRLNFVFQILFDVNSVFPLVFIDNTGICMYVYVINEWGPVFFTNNGIIHSGEAIPGETNYWYSMKCSCFVLVLW